MTILKNYKVLIPYFIIDLFYIIFGNKLLNYLYENTNFYPTSTLHLFIHLIISMCLFYWTYMAWVNQHYYIGTKGRSYSYDHKLYNLGYSDLFRFFRNANPHEMSTEDYKEEAWYDTEGIILGRHNNKLIKLDSTCEKNIILIGPPGTGKTSQIIPTVISFSNNNNNSILCVDVKGDIEAGVQRFEQLNYNKTKRKIIKFCPEDIDNSYSFDALYEIHKLEKNDIGGIKVALQNISNIIIPSEGEHEFFSTNAKRLFIGISAIILENSDDIKQVSLPDIIKQILENNVFYWVEYAISDECTSSIGKEYLSSYFQSSEKNLSGCYSTLVTSLNNLTSPTLNILLSNKGENYITPEMLDKEACIIFLQVSQNNLEVYSSIFTLIITIFGNYFFSRPDNSTGVKTRSVLFVIDELANLNFPIQLLNKFLSTLRSKNVLLLLALQTQAQLQWKYQRGADIINANCHVHLVTGSNENITSSTYANLVGKKAVLTIGTSGNVDAKTRKSINRQVSESKEYIYCPEDIQDMPSKGKALLYNSGKHLEVDKISFYNDYNKLTRGNYNEKKKRKPNK